MNQEIHKDQADVIIPFWLITSGAQLLLLKALCTLPCCEDTGRLTASMGLQVASLGHCVRVLQASAATCPDLMGRIPCADVLMQRTQLWSAHARWVPAAQPPGSTWITKNNAFRSGSVSRFATTPDQFRSRGDSGRSPTVD